MVVQERIDEAIDELEQEEGRVPAGLAARSQ